MIKTKNNKDGKKPDAAVLTIVFLLLAFGLTMIASAGVILSKTKFEDEYFFFKHQLLYGVLPGLLILYFVQKINYKWWKKVAVPFFFLALVTLILVFIPGFGTSLQGASRWLDLGPISFQPTEIMKLALILYLAVWIESRGERLKKFTEGTVPFALILGLVGFLVMKQPDMGTLGLIVIVAVSMFFVSGVPITFLASLSVVGIFLFYLFIRLAPYRMNRILSFLDPGIDPQGIGYQINQALIAVGTGGIFGLGLGHSRQKFNYLPEPVGDSIFAVTAEELGLIGAGFLVFLFFLLAMRGFKIARYAPDRFSQLVAIGIVCWIVFQALINIMAIIGLIPLTGIPLPFVSYGSTSMVFILTAVGILLNISKYSRAE
ncbi:MAG: putative lipid II flippase FtsW [Candidatus Moranbacteria bacterium]|nr:putative lipid II flippase FtsW [Candidatus Moranbacteria bacterium]